MDTRFSSAIHTLIMIAGAETPMTSDQIAESVGTNASYIRKITGLRIRRLKKWRVVSQKAKPS
jgi:DNA-binding IscR family transcriptional regulator